MFSRAGAGQSNQRACRLMVAGNERKDRASSTTARPATTPSALARNVATACVLAGTLRSTQAVLGALYCKAIEPRRSGLGAEGARALRGHVANINRVLLQRSQHALHPRD